MDIEKNHLKEMANGMLNDSISSRAYEWLFKRYESLFKDKIIMDVGCRSGLLSLMSVQTGAVKVIAVGNAESAYFVKKAISNTEKEDIFEFVKGDIRQIRLPCGLKKVDIIVSEWIGHSIFVDSLFKEVIYARDKWLVKGGLIVPNVAQLLLYGVSDHPREKIEDYPKEDYVPMENIVTEKFLLTKIDLLTANINDENFKTPFKVRGLVDSRLGAVVLYSDIGFSLPQGNGRRIYSTSPKKPRSYLKQTILFVDNPVVVARKELVEGVLGMYYRPNLHRKVEYSLSFENCGSEELEETK
ncbi:LOW QUALITY PROTEIN: protein arginine N-methyltransferase 1.1 [Drosophila eugracilis]|uniref:LOW QUALITY PROTEIN: protein arginine N-methyltransferase 1.1 n=1 Tax=Drosophila eugracilis TaxID=29029 RepID=UPI001BDAC127|nr:LOW QUALITY PROTEIN: protein arginine N-methyltransferase 1.1 [Drosophila eugracilis]